jgi:hypothetical protein
VLPWTQALCCTHLPVVLIARSPALSAVAVNMHAEEALLTICVPAAPWNGGVSAVLALAPLAPCCLDAATCRPPAPAVPVGPIPQCRLSCSFWRLSSSFSLSIALNSSCSFFVWLRAGHTQHVDRQQLIGLTQSVGLQVLTACACAKGLLPLTEGGPKDGCTAPAAVECNVRWQQCSTDTLPQPAGSVLSTPKQCVSTYTQQERCHDAAFHQWVPLSRLSSSRVNWSSS